MIEAVGRITVGVLEYPHDINFNLIKRRGKGLIKTFADKDGYEKYALTQNNKTLNLFKHKVIYEAANGPVPEGFTIDHSDNNKLNNSVNNLKLLTNKENVIKGNAKNWKFISPNGEVIDVYNLNEFSRENKLNPSHMQEVHSGKVGQHKGWRKYG